MIQQGPETYILVSFSDTFVNSMIKFPELRRNFLHVFISTVDSCYPLLVMHPTFDF